jgi:predicted metal-dependent hydrolase
MSIKNERIAALIQRYRGRERDARYLAYFECFHQERFFDAHEVLEALWLEDRAGGNGGFYKGLIQLAGAFVHLQKSRPGPAAALFRLAEFNLRRYPSVHEGLDVAAVLNLAQQWREDLETGRYETHPLGPARRPQLRLEFPSGDPLHAASRNTTPK